eukprot:scaffold18261_cov141-Skeletonema_marinoi.AAC.5
MIIITAAMLMNNDCSSVDEQHQLPAAAATNAASLPNDDDSSIFAASLTKDNEAAPPHLLLGTKQRRSNKRKQITSSDNDDDQRRQQLLNQIHTFQHSPHSLRLSASSIAALCGLHPYQNLPQLFFDLIYQSHLGQSLLQNDASLLGLHLIEDAKSYERQQLLAMASSISHETHNLVQTSLAVSEGTTKLQSVEEVQSIQHQIKTHAIQSGKLTERQVDSLVDASRQNLSTGFGNAHEEEALDLYEGVVGCCVRERNEALMTWKFERVELLNCGGGSGVTARPMGVATRREWGDMMTNNLELNGKNDDDAKKSEEKSTDKTAEVIVIDDTTATTSTANTTSPSVQEQQNQHKCFFKIVGAVDGIRDEIYIDQAPPQPPTISSTTDANNNNHNSSDKKSMDTNDSKDITPSNHKNDEYNFSDDDSTNEQWTIRPIIVECKHRMTQAKVPPPLYDQIQTCLYINMYNVEEADLIQVVRRKRKRMTSGATPVIKNEDGKENDVPIQVAGGGMMATVDDNKNKEENNKEKKKKEDNNVQITISRISLHDPIHNHQHHWNQTLLPRLASFVDAVYNVRKDDGKRYRLLMALVQEQNYDSESNEAEAWKVLWDEMPWLRSCDTSFGRRGRR